MDSPSSRPAVAGNTPAVSRGISRTARDIGRERRFLAAAAGGEVAFVQHAVARLALGEAEYADSWSRRPIAELLAELADEAADMGAWGARSEQRLDREPQSASERARLAAVLALVAEHGAQAHRLLVAAIREGGA